MDAEESGNPSAPASNPILPHYPELIFAAIEALDSKNGANKSKISKQIEASYVNLPAAHKTLLSHHLNKLRATGELVVIKNNYVKPDLNSPPPRARGRPPKPKEPVPEGTVISPARPRGRPRKSLDPFNPVSSKASPAVSGRKRGRPPKLDKDTSAALTLATDEGSPAATSEKKGRGRPRKEKTGDAPAPEVEQATGEKKGRGRPRKEKTGDAPAPEVEPATGEKKGRGRPRKEKSADAPAPAQEPATGERRGRGRPPKVKAIVLFEA